MTTTAIMFSKRSTASAGVSAEDQGNPEADPRLSPGACGSSHRGRPQVLRTTQEPVLSVSTISRRMTVTQRDAFLRTEGPEAGLKRQLARGWIHCPVTILLWDHRPWGTTCKHKI